MLVIRLARVALVTTVWFTAFGTSFHGASTAVGSQTQAAGEAEVSREFEAMLARVDVALLELQNGRSAAFKALWSRADDITLAGGFGGTIEKGWEPISRRLDWAAAQYSKGTHTHERIVAKAGGSLGYVVQLEHIRFHIPGQANESTRDYRVTIGVPARI